MTEVAKRKWPWGLWAGVLLIVASFVAMPVFVANPLTRDFAWPVLVLLAAGEVLILAALFNSFRRPAIYRGKILGAILALASTAVLLFFIVGIFYFGRVPVSTGVPGVGQKAPEFSLMDQDNKSASLSDLLAEPVGNFSKAQGALLMFYRGYW